MSLEEIEHALRFGNYPEYLIKDWAAWLHENYWAEQPHLRDRIFFQILNLTYLSKQR